MTRKPPVLQPEDAAKSERIRRLVADYLMQSETASPGVDEDLLRQHPDLLPELRDELKKLRLLQELARKARAAPDSCGDSTGRKRDLRREQAHLEEALKGYQIVGRIDHGGQGAVYQGVQQATHRHVAIKVLLDGPLASAGQLRRFEREVRLNCRLRHPNIVTIYDSGIVNGRPYFVMEFVDGVPIDDYTLFHLPSVEECVRLFVKVCRALGYAHQRGIIHRDLKPANVLVDMNGEPKVLDFGLAKALDDEFDFGRKLSITTPGRILGTLPFMSPEQIDEIEGEIDVRTDIYSLGVVLYRLLTGVFPYPVNVGTAQLYRNIVEMDPLSPRKAAAASSETTRFTRGEVSDDLDRIVLKALAKDKERRYQSALAFADDLDRYLAGDAVEAKAESGFYVFKKTLKRYRRQVVSACAVLVIAILASVLVTQQWLTARAERKTATHLRDIALASLDDVVGEVIESVGSLAGASAVQDTLLEIVRKRYRQLMPLLESDETMTVIEARIYERLGDMAAKEGHHAEAAEKFQTCLRMRDTLASDHEPDPHREIETLRVLRKLAEVADDRVPRFERAVEFGEALAGRRPDDLNAAYELCAARIGYARHLFRSGEYSRVVELAGRSISAAERATGKGFEGEDWVKLLAEAHQWEGNGRIKLGEGELGLASLEESVRLHQRLVDRASANVHLRHGLLEASMRLGTAYRDAGRLQEARALFERAIAAGEYLTASDPDVAAWKHALFITYDRIISLLLRSKEFDVAGSYADRGVGLARDLAEAEPENVEWRRLLGFARANRGEVFYARDKWQGACEDFVETVRIRKEILSSDPTNQSHVADLADAYDWLGKCVARLGDSEEGLANHMVSYELRKRLARQDPNVVRHALSCVASQLNLSSWHLARKTAQHDATAAALIRDAESALDAVHERSDAMALQDQYDHCLRALEKNKKLLEKRANPPGAN